MSYHEKKTGRYISISFENETVIRRSGALQGRDWGILTAVSIVHSKKIEKGMVIMKGKRLIKKKLKYILTLVVIVAVGVFGYLGNSVQAADEIGISLDGVLLDPTATYEMKTSSIQLMMETSGGGGSESLATGWTIMDMCGGKLDALDLLSETRCSVSAKTAEDSAKMDIICDFLEKTAGMSDDYLNIRFGAGIEEQMGFVRNDDGSIYAWQDDFSNTVFGQTNACSWGQLIVSRPANLARGATEVVDIWTERAMKLKNEAMEMDRWSVNYRFLNPDSTVKTEAGNVESQFVSRYILGETDDYDGFVESWLSSGGQELLEDAEQTFRKYGLME